MKNYPLYHVDDVTNLRDLIRIAARKFESRTAFAWYEGEVVKKKTFEQFLQDVNSLGAALYDMGFTPAAASKRDTLPPRIAVIGENSYNWLVTYFAVVNGGNVIVPLDKDLPEESLRNILDESGASAVVYSDTYAEIFEGLKVSKKVKTLKTFINMRHDLPGVITHGQGLLLEGKTAYFNAPIDETRTAAIIFTSGTTGLAKGVELTHRGLAHNVINGHKLIKLSGPTVLILPLHHTYGFAASVVSTFILGCMCFINDSLRNVLRDIQTAKPDFIAVVPLFVENFYKKIMAGIKEQGKEKLIGRMSGIVNAARRKVGIDLRRIVFKKILNAFGGKLEVLISGGAALNPDLLEKFSNFGITIIEGYGITECSPIVSLNRNKWHKARSVGQIVPGVKVKIIEPNSEGNGEICVKGPIVMNGYYKKPDVTASVMEDGWFRTGDIGHFDDDNFLYITGRKKNLIILSNGKNIHPEELEELITQTDEVSEVIVRESGNDIMAEVYPNYEYHEFEGLDHKGINAVIEQKIKELNKELPVYKRIKKIVIRDVEFEKTTTKKIKRW